MSIHSLPPELLLYTFSFLAAPRLQSSTDFTLKPFRELLACALVHSTWRAPAQEILFEDVRLSGRDDYDEELGKLVDSLGRTADRGFQPKRLAVEGNIELLPSKMGTEMWSRTTHLFHWWHSAEGSTEFRTLAHFFPALTSLHLEWSQFQMDDSIVFSNLRRLALGDNAVLHGSVTAYKRLFSPTCLPKLVHLALDTSWAAFDLDEYFHELDILPQLETLALCDYQSSLDVTSFFKNAPPLTNLKHLEISTQDPVLGPRNDLFLYTTHLDLDSFHLKLGLNPMDELLVEGLVSLTWEDGPKLRTKRVVAYGHQHIEQAYYQLLKLDVSEWRDPDEGPRFAEFDGR